MAECAASVKPGPWTVQSGGPSAESASPLDTGSDAGRWLLPVSLCGGVVDDVDEGARALAAPLAPP
jgi:hypothetical protein